MDRKKLEIFDKLENIIREDERLNLLSEQDTLINKDFIEFNDLLFSVGVDYGLSEKMRNVSIDMSMELLNNIVVKNYHLVTDYLKRDLGLDVIIFEKVI